MHPQRVDFSFLPACFKVSRAIRHRPAGCARMKKNHDIIEIAGGARLAQRGLTISTRVSAMTNASMYSTPREQISIATPDL